MKHALITGASSGIGYQLAVDYAEMEYQVTACARSLEKLEELRAQYPTNIRIIQVDLADRVNVTEKLSSVEKVDLVLLNAGTCEYVEIEQFDASYFERVFQVNVMGVSYCIESLKNKITDGGQLAIVGSLARHLPFTRSAAYGGSKAAIHYMTKSLAVDLAGKNVSVHTVSPGFVKTPLTDKNDFSMPFLISVDEASKRIISGLKAKKSDVSFPRRLSWTLKVLSLMPESIQHKICVWMRDQAK